MEELIFFGVIIFFSILESIARSRRARRGEEAGGELPELPDPGEWEPELPELPTYDAEPSYDERATAKPERHRPASETMLPADLLEELAGLTKRGQEMGRTVEMPRPSPPSPEPQGTTIETYRGAPLPASRAERRPAPVPTVTPAPRPDYGVTRPDHRVHLSHRGFGTDPSERHRFEKAPPPPAAAAPDAAAVRKLLQSQSGSALRQAIILHEVLGPPAAMRADRFGPED